MCEKYKTYSGKEFNEYLIKHDIHIIKLFNEKEKHFDYQYHDGLNILQEQFNTTNKCSNGGFYFCEEKYILYWLNNFLNIKHIRYITIPDTAQVYVEPKKFKCDKIFLNEKISLKEFEIKSKNLLDLILHNGMLLKFINKQTDELCINAVKQNGLALEYVGRQTEEICLQSVKQNYKSLKFVILQTDEICINAVKQNGLALEYVRRQTEEICLNAVKKDGFSLYFVNSQTEEICLEAIKQYKFAYHFVNKNIKSKIKL